MKRPMRTLRILCLSVLALVLLAFVAVQFQQHLLRYRVEQLMADMHRIRLYQSTWGDAQQLQRRWGAWGQYNGTCTATACAYRITISDISNRQLGWLMRNGGFRIYSLLGGRSGGLIVSFTVQDGTIVRETASMSVTASPKLLSGEDEFPPTLIVQTKSRQRLRQTQSDWWIMGDDDQLAEHPYYKAGRPGGCKINCEEAVVTYSTRTPQSEIDRLTSFNLFCLTQFSSCTELEQLLPAVKDWHLYHEVENSAMQEAAHLPKPCAVPLWAVARDSRYALIVEGMQKSTMSVPDSQKEEAHVRILKSLKGSSPWSDGTVVLAHPFGDTENYPSDHGASDHLVAGKKYIVFPIGDDRRDQLLTRDSTVELEHCGVWDNSPEHLREVEKGVAQNDQFRGPESR